MTSPTRDTETAHMDAFVNRDMVDHPAHYGGKDNPYEVIKVIEAYSLSFSLGNAIKYILRSPSKGKQLEDLKKARWYLDRKITALEAQHNTSSVRGAK